MSHLPVPEVLYHGTSYGRLSSIETNGLRGDWPRIYKSGLSTVGYVFLTAIFDDAAFYAVKTVEMEKSLSIEEKRHNGITQSDLGVIITIKTNKLSGLEVDYESLGELPWYKYRGNIEIESISSCKIVAPLKDHPRDFVDKVAFDIKLTRSLENGDYKEFLKIISNMKNKNIYVDGILDRLMKTDYKFFAKVMKNLRYDTKYFSLSELPIFGKYEKLRREFDGLLESNPSDFDLWYKKGNILYHLGLPRAAYECFSETLGLEPNHLLALEYKQRCVEVISE